MPQSRSYNKSEGITDNHGNYTLFQESSLADPHLGSVLWYRTLRVRQSARFRSQRHVRSSRQPSSPQAASCSHNHTLLSSLAFYYFFAILSNSDTMSSHWARSCSIKSDPTIPAVVGERSETILISNAWKGAHTQGIPQSDPNGGISGSHTIQLMQVLQYIQNWRLLIWAYQTTTVHHQEHFNTSENGDLKGTKKFSC